MRAPSRRQTQMRRADALRSAGATWSEVAATLGVEFGVNARVALRMAHGWSQSDVADRWNERWPDDPKTFKNISYWERWPAASGHAPSVDVLGKLATVYQCHVTDLLIDGADHRDADAAFLTRRELRQLAAGATLTDQAARSAAHETLDDLVARWDAMDVQDLAREAAEWATQLPSTDRRSLLLKLGFALTSVAATPEHEPITVPPPRDGTPELSGVWRSRYAYYSDSRGSDFEGMHDVVVRQQDTTLTVESLPQASGSRLTSSLEVEGTTATGTWEERTSPSLYYRGAVYRGAIQLLIAPSGGRMSGRWIGFGKNFRVNNGEWEFTLETRSVSSRSLAQFRGRL